MKELSSEEKLKGKVLIHMTGKNKHGEEARINDMRAMFIEDRQGVYKYLLSLDENPKKNVVLVFDGDNLDDDPFTTAISELAGSVFAILVVKRVPNINWGYSKAFVDGWSRIDSEYGNNSGMQQRNQTVEAFTAVHTHSLH